MSVVSKSPEQKQELLNERKSFCILPRVHLYAEPDGTVFPCCTATPLWDGEMGEPGTRTDPYFATSNIKDKSILEALNTPNFNKLRLDMLNGEELPSTCTRCKRFEDVGNDSYRHYGRRHVGQVIDAIDNTNEDGSLKKLDLKFLNVRFSNHCNMACLTCNAQWSTTWYDKSPWLWKDKTRTKLLDLNDNSKYPIWEEIEPYLHTVEKIYFTGGEPLMRPAHWKILKYLVDNNLEEKVELQYNTNLSRLKFGKQHAMDYWPKFKEIDLGLSIDGVEKDIEIIRWGTKWNDVVANIKEIQKYDNIRYSIDSVISIFNIYHLPKMVTYFHNEKLTKYNTNTVANIAHEPEPLSLTSIPSDMKPTVEAFLKTEWEKLPIEIRSKYLNTNWQTCIDYMYARDTYKPGKLSEHINATLNFAKDSLLEHIPLVKMIYERDAPFDRWNKNIGESGGYKEPI